MTETEEDVTAKPEPSRAQRRRGAADWARAERAHRMARNEAVTHRANKAAKKRKKAPNILEQREAKLRAHGITF